MTASLDGATVVGAALGGDRTRPVYVNMSRAGAPLNDTFASAIVMSGDASRILVGTTGPFLRKPHRLYASINRGTSWTDITTPNSTDAFRRGIATSGDAVKLATVVERQNAFGWTTLRLHVSTNGAATFNDRSGTTGNVYSAW